jgi:hypothetical protein
MLLMMHIRRRFSCFLTIALLTVAALPLLAGCGQSAVMPGDVASVNGEGISLREVEARRVSVFARLTPGGGAMDDATLQAQYRHVVRQIVEEIVVCQYMRDKGFTLPEEALEAEEQRIRADYPKGEFEQMLLEEGVSTDIWRRGIRRRLIMEQFITQELRPQISITTAEVEQYYRSRTQDFVIPEQWHFLQILGMDGKEVEAARESLIQGGNPLAAQRQFLVTIHDIRMGKELLPESLNRELEALAPGQGTKVKAHDEMFRAFVMVEKLPAAPLDAATISQRVEQAIAEEKMRAVYARWIDDRLAKADIRMASELLDDLVTSGDSPADPAPSGDAPPPAAGNTTSEDAKNADIP